MVENPYQSPAEDNCEWSENGWYTSNMNALRYGEMWQIHERWPTFLRAALAKAFGGLRSDRLAFKALEPVLVVGAGQLPSMAQERLQPIVTECLQLDMDLVFYGTAQRRDRNEGFAAHLVARDGMAMALAMWVISRVKQFSRELSHCSLLSYLDDGTILSTSNLRRMLDAPPIYDRCHIPGASIAETVRRHRIRLWSAGMNRVQRIQKEDVLRLTNENKRRLAEFHIRRGFWVPRPEVACADSAV